MNAALHEIVKLGVPINTFYEQNEKERAKRKPALMKKCAVVLKLLLKKVPTFKVEHDDDGDLDWIRSCFHLFGEFVQLAFTDPKFLEVTISAILSFLKASDDGEDFAPYQTLVKLYTALGQTDNAYQIVSNTKKAYGKEPFFADILKSAPYKAWSKKRS